MILRHEYDQDSYGEVVNSDNTARAISDSLHSHGSVIIGWTDNAGTHLDILFVYKPQQTGGLGRGMNTNTDVFVAVSGFGMFGFDISNLNGSDAGYVGEKLGLGGHNVTTEKLAELINGVRQELSR